MGDALQINKNLVDKDKKWARGRNEKEGSISRALCPEVFNRELFAEQLGQLFLVVCYVS